VERRSASTLLGLFPVRIPIANAISFSIPSAIDSKASINFALNRNLAPYVFVLFSVVYILQIFRAPFHVNYALDG